MSAGRPPSTCRGTAIAWWASTVWCGAAGTGNLVNIFSGQPGSTPPFSELLSAAHFAGLLVVTVAVAVAFRHLLTGAWDREAWLDRVLALSAGATAIAFLLSGYAQDATAIRYLSPGFIFGVVLAGRTAPGLLAPVPRHSRSHWRSARERLRHQLRRRRWITTPYEPGSTPRHLAP